MLFLLMLMMNLLQWNKFVDLFIKLLNKDIVFIGEQVIGRHK